MTPSELVLNNIRASVEVDINESGKNLDNVNNDRAFSGLPRGYWEGRRAMAMDIHKLIQRQAETHGLSLKYPRGSTKTGSKNKKTYLEEPKIEVITS